ISLFYFHHVIGSFPDPDNRDVLDAAVDRQLKAHADDIRVSEKVQGGQLVDHTDRPAAGQIIFRKITAFYDGRRILRILIIRCGQSEVCVECPFAGRAFSRIHDRGCDRLHGVAQCAFEKSDIITGDDISVSNFLRVDLYGHRVCLLVRGIDYVGFEAVSDGNDGHDGGDADDDTEHGEEGAPFVGADIVQRHLYIFKKLSHTVTSLPGSLLRVLTGSLRLGNRSHAFLDICAHIVYDHITFLKTFYDLHMCSGGGSQCDRPFFYDAVLNDVDEISVSGSVYDFGGNDEDVVCLRYGHAD